MNRGAMGIGISIAVIVLLFVVMGFFVRDSRADGSPKELKPVSDELTAKIEAAAPEKATASPQRRERY